MTTRAGWPRWVTPLLFPLVLGALTWWLVARSEDPVSPVRAVGAAVLVLVLLGGWDRVDRRLLRVLVPERSWLYVLVGVMASLMASAAYFAVLGLIADAVPAMVGSALGQVFGARRRAERVEDVPAGVLDKDDGRRWRVGSP